MTLEGSGKASWNKKHLKCNLMMEEGKTQAENGKWGVGQESLQERALGSWIGSHRTSSASGSWDFS